MAMSGRTVITFLFILSQLALGAMATRFSILNSCPYTVWIGATPAAGLIMFDINQGELLLNDLDDSWRGELYFRTHCGPNSNGDFHCITGDCGGREECDGNIRPQPPVTTLEFIRSSDNNINSLYSYAVNLDNGFNVPVSIVPQGGGGTGGCRPTGCYGDLNKVCPQQLQVIEGGNIIGCNSDCTGFRKPEDCCTGDFFSPGACKPSRSAQLFKQTCPQAHTWRFDGGVESCAAAIFNITLCP